MKIVAVGPFVGDFETEITSFRPYVTWLYCNESHDAFYVSSHFDRRFLYHWVPDSNYLPVMKEISENVENQKCYFNDAIDHNSYLKLVRKFRNSICESTDGINKEDVRVLAPAYTKLADPVHFNKKLFTSISVKRENGDYVLFENEVFFDKYKHRRLSNIKLFQKKIEAISSAKVVVCEAGIWTIISNMQKVPVFSWSEGAIGKYKEKGDFNFGNKNMVVYADNKKTLLRSMENYLIQTMEF